MEQYPYFEGTNFYMRMQQESHINNETKFSIYMRQDMAMHASTQPTDRNTTLAPV